MEGWGVLAEVEVLVGVGGLAAAKGESDANVCTAIE